MSSISAVLIVYNEEARIEQCLKSLSWVDEIVVVDDQSTDQTPQIVQQYTQNLYQRKFDNYANQKNFGIEKANSDWILSVDADEVVSPELKESVLETARDDQSLAGYYVLRDNYIFGRKFRFGGHYHEKILRFFKKDKGRFEGPIHEQVVVDGQVGCLKGVLDHFSTPSVKSYLGKLDKYTDFEAARMFNEGVKVRGVDLWLHPMIRFFYTYVLKCGFLDGWEGLIYNALSSFYYFLKYAKLRDLQEGQSAGEQDQKTGKVSEKTYGR